MKNILIIDDDKLNLATARRVLSAEYKVIPAMKGTQALAYLQNGDCDIILLDINMPEMDGFEVLQKIRQMESCKDIPVIFSNCRTLFRRISYSLSYCADVQPVSFKTLCFILFFAMFKLL